MEHEVFVPVSPARLSHALRDPARVSAALPGWQPDAPEAQGGTGTGGPDGQAGRLRLRVGGSTITYRGTVRVTGTAAPFAVEASGTEVRGTGTVKATLEITVAAASHPEPGAQLTFRGAAQADGRLAAYEPAVVEAAVRRLLDRFSAELAARAPQEEAGEGTDAWTDPGAPDAPAAETGQVTGEATDLGGPGDAPDLADVTDLSDLVAGEEVIVPVAASTPDASDASDAPDPSDAPEEWTEPDASGEDEPEADVVDDLGEPAPPAGLEDFELVEVEVEVPESAAALDDLEPPAEAAHARRTMIGRSAEEVDHAPPRGRYAPVPAPDATSAAATLRWAAPAAAALLASAVVVGRVLRRRR